MDLSQPTTPEKRNVAFNTAVEKIRDAAQVEIKRLKKRHQEAIAHVRASTQKQLEGQRADLEEKFAVDLSSALEEVRREGRQRVEMEICARKDEVSQVRGSLTAELATLRQRFQETTDQHQNDMSRLKSEHQTQLSDVEASTQVLRSASEDHSYRAELIALQQRLDASLTGQAEAEKAVAMLRQQKSENDKQAGELKSFKERLRVMSQENENLKRKKTQLRHASLQDFRPRLSMDAKASFTSATDERATLKLQLASLEQERAEIQTELEKSSAEKSELSRQNEFLVKELELALMRRSNSTSSSRSQLDGSVQKGSLASEPQPGLATAQFAKLPLQQPAHARTSIRLSSTEENFFGRKLHEHTTSLQTAQDRLLSKYGEKITAITVEKERREEMVMTTQAEIFADAYKQLVLSYGGEVSDLDAADEAWASSSQDLRQERVHAEQRILKKCHRHLIREQSRIAVKHAAKFHQLMQSYDQEINKLIAEAAAAELETDAPTSNLQHILNQLELLCTRLETEMLHSFPTSPDRIKPRSRRSEDEIVFAGPKRTSRPQVEDWTSTPRTIASIPRIQPHAKLTEDPDTPPRHTSISTTHSDEHDSARSPPVKERSPQEARQSSGFTWGLERVKSQRSLSPRRLLPSPIEDDGYDMVEDAGLFEAEPRTMSQRSLERSSRFSISPAAQKRPSSKRLSSGLIYSQPPRQSQPATVFDAVSGN